MPQPTDRNLLVGILALQMDFVSRDQLLAAMNAWVLQKDKPLELVLFDNKALSSDTMALLQALVAKHLEIHGNNAQQSLQSLSSIGDLRTELQSLADPDVQATLSHVAKPAGTVDATVDHQATQIDAICDKFVRAWRDGQQPKIEDYLLQLPATAQDELLEELLREEIQLRRAAGDVVRAEDYQSRFPQHHAIIARAFTPPSSRGSRLGSTIEFRRGGGRGDSGSETRFRVIRPHAKGGLGEVFVARDTELNREVALKEIQERFAANPDSRSRFLLEAEVTGGLEHPGIVPVYGLGQYADGRPFYAMRFIKGDSLKEAVERFHGRQRDAKEFTTGEVGVEFRQLLGRFVDVCQAIEYAHSRGVLHRDLKPGNIMLGKYGETLVVDWGLAKVVGRTEQHKVSSELTISPESGSGSAPTQMGSAVGTPVFMSPEQAAGRLDELGPATDVYSLGATLYHILTGQPPFTDRDLADILRRVQAGDFPRPRELSLTPRKGEPAAGESRPGSYWAVPVPLEAICLKAMSLRPSDRYGSAAELAKDVERYLADEPVLAISEPFTERARRWVKRHQTLVGSTAAAVLVATVSLSALVLVVSNNNKRLTTALADTKQAKQEADQAKLAAVQGLVTALRHAPAARVPESIDALLRHRDVVVPILQERFAGDQGIPKLQLGLGLAALGQAPYDFLTDQIIVADPESAANLLFVFQLEPAAYVARIRERFGSRLVHETVDGGTRFNEQEVLERARLAIMALDLGQTADAIEMLHNGSDPRQRTCFIEQFGSREHAWVSILEALTSVQDPDFRSGLVIALGGLGPDAIPDETRQRLVAEIGQLYLHEEHAGVRSAAEWNLRKWSLPIPPRDRDRYLPQEQARFSQELGISLVLVPRGSFDRTVSEAEAKLAVVKGPAVVRKSSTASVTLSHDFYLADREVTLSQFREFVRDSQLIGANELSTREGGTPLPRERPQAAARAPNQLSSVQTNSSPYSQVGPTLENQMQDDSELPVQNITWEQAVLFCNWLSKKDGLTPAYRDDLKTNTWQLLPESTGYRLPTEAEWEYACRAGTSTLYCFGDNLAQLEQYAAYRTRLSPVASRRPNAWGLFDMHGNVSEWCQDWYQPFADPVKDSGEGNGDADALGDAEPKSGKQVINPTGPGSGERRVVRGGSFRTDAVSGTRFHRNPTERDVEVGFRVARSKLATAALAKVIPPDDARADSGPEPVAPSRPGAVGDAQPTLAPLPALSEPETLAHDNFTNAGFEETAESRLSGWKVQSYKQQPDRAQITTVAPRLGKKCLQIQSAMLDDIHVVQRIVVKAHADYELSGWVRTEGVEMEPGSSLGATISIADGFECTESVHGTNNWRHVRLSFNSGDRTTIRVGPRLGHHGSLAKGTAWFDDVVVSERPRKEK